MAFDKRPDDVLLERDDALAALETELERALLGVGRIVLVGGEAGVGKTALVRLFAAEHTNDARVVWGACEALFTPRPLGPVYDIVESLEGWSLEPPTTDAARAVFFGALLEALRACPTVRGVRGRPLGRRGDARCPEVSRPPCRLDAVASRSHIPRRRDRSATSASPGPRRHPVRIHDTDLARATVDRCSRGARAPRGSSVARVVRDDRRESLLRHGGARGGRRRHPSDGPRRSPRSRGPPQRWRAAAAGCSRDRAWVDRDRIAGSPDERRHRASRRVPRLRDADADGPRRGLPARARPAGD